MDGEHPGAVATIFSFPWEGNHAQQRLVHELHSLMETPLVSINDNAVQRWMPSGGIQLYPLQTSVDVPDNPARRQLRMRQLSRSFQAHTIDQEAQRWPLRMMPKELLAYESDSRAGAMFAMLGDAGADPELLLIIEAKRDGQDWHWRYAPIRMTDQEIFVSADGREIWTSTHDDVNTRFHNANQTYFRFPDKFYDATGMLRQDSTVE